MKGGFDLPSLVDEVSEKEAQLMLECYCGIPNEEEVLELNELQRAKVRRFLEEHGWGYGVNINLNEYHLDPIFRVQSVEEANCDALIPPNADGEKLRELKEVIELWNKNSLNEVGREALDRVFELLEELGAVELNWY